jgi:GNAT superfamily N-acetyltransferase
MSDIQVRFAIDSDMPQLKNLDPWPRESVWQHKIAAREVIVLEADATLVGLARYTLLWTTVPFLGLIFILEPYRGQGLSRRLLDFLCDHLRAQGYVALLSSSQTDEVAPQNWHRHMGFYTNGVIENIADDNVGEIVYRLLLQTS